MHAITLSDHDLPKRQIYKNEFVYLRLPSERWGGKDETVVAQVDSLAQMSEKVYVSINDGLKTLDPDLLIADGKIKWVGFSILLKGQKSETGSSVFSSIDKEAVTTFKRIRSQFKNSEAIIPEIRFQSDFSLGPTIWELFQTFDLPFAFLRVEGLPTNKSIQRIKEAFEYLRIRGLRKNIYFNFDNIFWKEWNKQTLNTFSGISTVHIDLSNKCTHSCVFCGLWGPDFIEQSKKDAGNKIDDNLKNFMNRQMKYEKAIEILESLPFTIDEVQFGGAGDPLTHPQWLDIVSQWRNRGMTVEVLSNFEYPNYEQLEKLHEISKGDKNLRFIINVSAASAEVYTQVRPRQTSETFEKVISNIRYSANLKKRDGHGLDIVMLQIINVYNYKEAVKMVELAHELGVHLWLKPLEVHGPIHKKFIIPKNSYDEFKKNMSKVLIRSEELGVNLLFKEFIEKIVIS